MTYKLTPGIIIDLASGQTTRLKQSQGRTNILLLGIGGGMHEGADLTDTIMVASVGLTNKDTVLLSVPRDIWLTNLKDKINIVILAHIIFRISFDCAPYTTFGNFQR